MPSPFKKFLGRLSGLKGQEPVAEPVGPKEDEDPHDLQERYTHFRILVIGRANAGKTTLLKRVCNTDEDPCIYDDNDQSLIEPTEERGIHDVNRPFSFRSNPRFIFHDSPGFEAGGERELIAVRNFIEERSKASNVNDQLHAIWFCFIPDVARPLLTLEERFFNENRRGDVPIIALFTKFDDLVSQVWDSTKTPQENIKYAEKILADKFEKSLRQYKFPPRSYVRFEDLNDDSGAHQQQVKVLIDQTAASLDITALKKLFVSVQTNNLEICIKNAIEEADVDNGQHLFFHTQIGWFPHARFLSHNYGVAYTGGAFDALFWTKPLLPMFFPSSDTRPTVAHVAGLLICIEHSFWFMKHNKTDEFKASFKKSCNMHKAHSQHERIEKEVEIRIQGDWKTEENQAELLLIVIENLLPRPE